MQPPLRWCDVYLIKIDLANKLRPYTPELC